MKHRFLLPVLLFSCLFCVSAETTVYYSENEDTRPKVEQTGTFSSLPSPGAKNNSGVPRGSTAGRLAVNNMAFVWKPSAITTKATGGADLISACLSDDETVLLIAERIGGSNKPNSTRLILVNIRNNKIIRSVLLNEKRISDVMFIPGSDKVLASSAAQKEFNSSDSLLVINLKRNKIIKESAPAGGKITSFSTDGTKAWYTVEGTSFISEISLDEIKAKPETIRSLVDLPRLALAPDNTTLIVYGKNKLEKYRVSQEKRPALLQCIDSPPRFSPTQVLIADDSGNCILLVEPDRKAVLYRETLPTELSEKPAGFQALFRKENLLLYGMLKNNAIARITLPATDIEGRPVVPAKLKPVNRNATWKLFTLSGSPQKAVLIDIRGNITLIEITKRRWKKSPVLTVDKTGMK